MKFISNKKKFVLFIIALGGRVPLAWSLEEISPLPDEVKGLSETQEASRSSLSLPSSPSLPSSETRESWIQRVFPRWKMYTLGGGILLTSWAIWSYFTSSSAPKPSDRSLSPSSLKEGVPFPEPPLFPSPPKEIDLLPGSSEKDSLESIPLSIETPFLSPLPSSGKRKKRAKDYYQLGLIHHKRHPDKAQTYFEKAANLGHTFSLYRLGRIFQEGRPNVPKDLKKAQEYFEKAAAQGHKWAQYELGCLHKEVPQKAEIYFKLAADQGHTEACYKLGCLYQKSYNLFSMPLENALLYLRKAATQDHEKAKQKISQLSSSIS